MIAEGFCIAKISRVQGFQHGIVEGIGFWHESYAKELWTSELHHVFALEAHVSGKLHHVSTLEAHVSGKLHHVFTLKAHVSGKLYHVFTLEVLYGGYLGHVFDAPGSLCLVAVSYCILLSVTHGLISPYGLMDSYDW